MSPAFLDAASLVLAFLRARIPGVEVVTRVPKTRPPELVRVWRNGGPARSRIVDAPLITFDVWAPSTPRAFELANEIRAALLNEQVAPQVRRVVEITGPYDNPDPESTSPRVRFSVQMTVRAARGRPHN